MKVGDPKQARILSVIAVGAVAFVVIQLLPGGSSNVGKVSQQIQERLRDLQNSSEKSPSDVQAFPPMLARNVFDHPYLSKSKGESDPQRPPARSKEENDLSTVPVAVPPPLPGLPSLEATPTAGSIEPNSKQPVQPEEKPTLITVDGVILRPTPTALISVNQESTTPAVGDLIANGYRLQKITDDAVILSRKGKKTTVPVGGSLTL